MSNEWQAFAVGVLAGVAFVRLMNVYVTRPCCKQHFLKHVNETCQHKLCNGKANHYGYCNLHWWLFKGIR